MGQDGKIWKSLGMINLKYTLFHISELCRSFLSHLLLFLTLRGIVVFNVPARPFFVFISTSDVYISDSTFTVEQTKAITEKTSLQTRRAECSVMLDTSQTSKAQMVKALPLLPFIPAISLVLAV